MTRSCVAAVDVGGTTIKAALFDGELRATVDRVEAVGQYPTAEALVAAVLDLTADVVHRSGGAARAVGLAVPGTIDVPTGTAIRSMILGWRDVPFAQLVAERTALPVGFGHDVAAGALAEQSVGAARGERDWLFLALGTGLGSTFVLDGRSYHGARGTGGELAHVVAVPGGPVCRCGKRGCVEMTSSAQAVAEQYVAAGGPAGSSAADVAQAVRRGEPLAGRIWASAVTALADVVAGYVESMNPSLVVLGGGLAESGRTLLDPFTSALRDRVAFADPVPKVRLAAFGARAGLVGAALLAQRALDPVPSRSIAPRSAHVPT